MTYAEKLRDPRWQKRRLEILKRDKWKCKLCKDETTELHVHHLEYTGEPWEAPNENLITLCAHCHYEIEKESIDLREEQVKVYKSNDWTNHCRIMMVKMPDYVLMRIYDYEGDYMVGFKLSGRTRKEIKKILYG